jgi:ubiquinone/menaquinone biosynthesis C-methylase UbiE
MSLHEADESNRFSFAPFAVHPFYTTVNRSLVQQALAGIARPRRAPLTIVDLACGTGAVTRLIAEEVARQGRQAHILGVDPSAEALRLAQQTVAGMEAGIRAEFIRGDADDLLDLVHDADAAFFCNAIHLLAEKRAAFERLAAILAPGGVFACNSAFYEGASGEATMRFSRLWIRRAVGLLRQAHPDVRVSHEAKVTARQWLPPETYVNLLQQSGFDQVRARQEMVNLSLDGVRDLGRYWLFIEGALPGVPLALGATALSTTVEQVASELGMTAVPRLWLQLLASKA